MITTEPGEAGGGETIPLTVPKWWQWLLILFGVVVTAFLVYLLVQIFFTVRQLLEAGSEVAGTISNEVVTFWGWGFDDNVPLADRLVAATLIATGISLVIAIIGIVVAGSATSLASQSERKRAKEELRRQIFEQPYVRTSLVGRGINDGSIRLRLHNTGGAARRCLFIVTAGANVYRLSDFDLSEGESREFHADRMQSIVYEPPDEREGESVRLAWGSARDRYNRLIRFSRSGEGHRVIESFTSVTGIINRREEEIPIAVPINQDLREAGIQGLKLSTGDY